MLAKAMAFTSSALAQIVHTCCQGQAAPGHMDCGLLLPCAKRCAPQATACVGRHSCGRPSDAESQTVFIYY